MTPVTAALAKLTKVLDLEEEQGFSDRAVIGGLSGFLDHWHDEASRSVSTDLVASVSTLLDGYSGFTTEERQARVASVREVLAAAAAPSHGSGPTGSRPGPEAGSDQGPPGAETDSLPSDKPEPTAEGRGQNVSGESDRAGPGSSQDRGADSLDEPSWTVDDPDLDRPVIHLRGFGKRSAENLGRMGIETIRELLFHAPSRYNDFRALKTINRLTVGEEATIVGTVWDVRRRKGRNVRDVLTVVLSDTTSTISCTFFNQPYLEKEFPTGRRIVVSGTVESWSGKLVFRSPEWERLDRELVHTARLVPVYPVTRGVTQRWLRGRLKTVVGQWADRVGDPVPANLREQYDLLTVPAAIRALHFPDDDDQMEAARRRLAFDELLTLQLWSRKRRASWQAQPTVDLAAGRGAVGDFVAGLPFQLTGAQSRSLDQIVDDLASASPMNRLLQGDVGSGKTAVAAGAMVMAVAAKAQAALMAPTEILAEQHYAGLTRLLDPLGVTLYDPSRSSEAPPTAEGSSGAIRLAKLVGSMRATEKESVREGLAAGEIDMLVGTHALIQESVKFRRLGLAVVDEQHRFGVVQRAELPARGDGEGVDVAPAPHALIMTATPIPRTLSMVLSADLDQSVIDELPPGRKTIRTEWIQPTEIERAYQFVRHRVSQGEQAYFVYPLVEESEVIQAKAAVAEYDKLRDEVFPNLQVGLVHGRLPAAEKEAAMQAFKSGETQVLVATSVIEVGVDVPNATVMLINGADRFGLAQLHQFRGRVGRGKAESTCLLVSEAPSATARERLEAIVATNDGLELAERDLQMRGPGDYFGVQQSGVVDRFKFARAASVETMRAASEAAETISSGDPGLEHDEHKALSLRVENYWSASERA